jgi:hypothetical protein
MGRSSSACGFRPPKSGFTRVAGSIRRQSATALLDRMATLRRELEGLLSFSTPMDPIADAMVACSTRSPRPCIGGRRDRPARCGLSPWRVRSRVRAGTGALGRGEPFPGRER